MSWEDGVWNENEVGTGNVRDLLSTKPYSWLERGASVYCAMKAQDLLSLAQSHFPHETMLIGSLRFLIRRLNVLGPTKKVTVELRTWPRPGACAGVELKVA